MLGIVTAHRLNVRSRPDKESNKRGVLPKGTAIPITGQLDDWFEFRYKDFPAYVYKSYVSLLSKDRDISATVTADLLNVRSGPDPRSSIIGKLPLFSRVEIISLLPHWAEIHFNDAMGYILRDHIELQQDTGSLLGKVTTGVLNVRNQPSAQASRVGQLTKDTTVAIQGRSGNWLQIQFNGAQAFVHSGFINEIEAPDEPLPGPVDSGEDMTPVPSARHRERTSLSPERQLPVEGDATGRKVAQTWNKYGGLLTELCDKIEIDAACAVSVLCVESSGKGFQPDNDGRMIIRFENHKFWKFWGRDNPEVFRQHFVFQSGKIWKGHKWRRDAEDTWQTFHGNQVREWQVLNFARTFNDEAALFSISMGAPQIMGFHSARIGYPTVAAMFEDFSRDIESHISGLMHFLDEPMINALRSLDFEAFAARYNGSGQKKTYGRLIKNHYDAFKLLAMTHSL